MKFGTKAIHAGVQPDPSTGAIMTPIYQTSTYVQAAPGDHKGYAYARSQNPTRTALETNLAALENGNHGICFASGLAAMDAILKMYQPGDEILCTNDVYGGSYRLLSSIFTRFGLKSRFIDMSDPAIIINEISSDTKLLWIETPTNPMLNIIDIAEAIADQLHFIQNAAGAVPGPMDCFLVLRGIKTLHLRVERSCQNAEKIAKFLKEHPQVSKVYYPGFEDHPNHDIAKKQMKMFGGMVSFDLVANTFDAAKQVLSGTHYFALAESLGGVESLIGHPASMTHASVPKEDRLKVGLTDSLIRLSVGVEDVEDLISDLDKALSALG